MQRRLAQLPLHGGKAPAWLFQRMTRLAGGIAMAVTERFGPREMLRRLADPWWFQAFGCVLGFDWHSSGLTTVTCAAMKEAYRRLGDDLGLCVAGGKGRASRKTPAEIAAIADRLAVTDGDRLIDASRLSAKVDSAAVQDGYDVYHHHFFFTPDGRWAVVQQGMNDASGWARRYHWLAESVDDFVCEPHHGVRDAAAGSPPAGTQLDLLNMTAAESDANRRGSVQLVREDLPILLEHIERSTAGPTLFAPQHHPVLAADVNLERLRRIVTAAHERQPTNYAALLGVAGVGPATVRSLALIAELIFDARPARRDLPTGRRWADYSYAHGGKDGTPFPVDRDTYDRNIAVLETAVRKARVGETEKLEAMRRLAAYAD